MRSNNTHSYWQVNLTLIRYLLGVWAFISFGVAIALARFLNHFELGQLPFGFWMAQQGALLVFIGLIFVYAFKMAELDRTHDMTQASGDQRDSAELD